ncbi:MAG TPA: aminotransferase class IV [Accumulibacter sp.]|nr:aminotransferase class IV [Accumulibacter sp.]
MLPGRAIGWLSPPLSCGLLPGVFRQSLLDAGRAAEQVLLLDDLRRGEPLYIGNALRGLLPVVLDQ